MKPSIMGMVLAGGEGTRLSPLTTKRAKPAVPFGGKYRIIDFVLSNFINSGIDSVFVLTQFRSQSLCEHLNKGWNISGSIMRGQFITAVPAQMQCEEKHWYSGTANAIWQNIDLVRDHNPDLLAVFGGDHIYKMDISQMADHHTKKGALATVSAIPVPVAEASDFGIIEVDREGRIIGFEEKPANPKTIPNNPDYCLASMGNYIFDTEWVSNVLETDAKNRDSSHDFGHDIITKAVDTGKLYAYDFSKNSIPDTVKGYWKDVGSLKAFYESNMDLREHEPKLNLYCPRWPIHTYNKPLPPAKFVHNERPEEVLKPRVGTALNSIVCDGCIISGSTVNNSILSPEVHVHSHAVVSDSIIMNGVKIGANCIVKNAIIDRNVQLEDNTEIGVNRAHDEERFTVVDLDKEAGTWLTVIEKNRGIRLLSHTVI